MRGAVATIMRGRRRRPLRPTASNLCTPVYTCVYLIAVALLHSRFTRVARLARLREACATGAPRGHAGVGRISQKPAEGVSLHPTAVVLDAGRRNPRALVDPSRSQWQRQSQWQRRSGAGCSGLHPGSHLGSHSSPCPKHKSSRGCYNFLRHVASGRRDTRRLNVFRKQT